MSNAIDGVARGITAPHESVTESVSVKLPCVQIIGRMGISLLAFAIHVLLVPISFAEAPLLALLTFTILVFVRRKSPVIIPPLPPLSRTRIVVFCASHALLLAVAFHYGANLGSVAADPTLTGTSFAALKLLILLPTIVLFPFDRALLRLIAPELIAALVVLLTFNPVRHFQLIWPAYSNLLGAAITRMALPFVPTASFAPAANGVIVTGPIVDLHVEFSCSGVNGVILFQLVFAIIVAVEWNRLSKLRALTCYSVGIVVYLLANLLRLVIVYLSGNLVSRTVNLNLPLFLLAFMGILRVCYEWMVSPSREPHSA